MIYKIFKETGRIGTRMEKTEASFQEMQNVPEAAANQIFLAAFDNETNTVHIYNDQIIDVSTIIQKFKNSCDLPNKHQFTILNQ